MQADIQTNLTTVPCTPETHYTMVYVNIIEDLWNLALLQI